MGCAACQARVEKAVNAVDGVKSCSVSLLTNTLAVEGKAREKDIIAAVEGAGYGIVKNSDIKDSGIKDTETYDMKKRLILSVIFLIPLMLVSMVLKNHAAMGLVQLVLSGIVMVINRKFFVSGFKGLIHGSPNMDTLVALGATASYGYPAQGSFGMSS